MYFFQSSQFSVIKMKNPKFTFPSTGIQKIEDSTSNQVLSLHKLVVIIRQMNIFFISFLHWLSWTLIISIPIEIDSNKKALSQTNLELKCFITQNIERGIFFGSKRRNLIDSNLSKRKSFRFLLLESRVIYKCHCPNMYKEVGILISNWCANRAWDLLSTIHVTFSNVYFSKSWITANIANGHIQTVTEWVWKINITLCSLLPESLIKNITLNGTRANNSMLLSAPIALHL